MKNFFVVTLPENYEIEIGKCSSEISINYKNVDNEHASITYDTFANEVILRDTKS
jgi:hypothetical protein